MNQETEASFGAWCALKSSLPSKNDIQSMSGRLSLSEMKNTLSHLSLPESCTSAFSIEQFLLAKYSRAVSIIERFFTSSSAKLSTWLREEFDWYNILLLLKNLRSLHDDEKTQQLLFKMPIATISPPEPEEIKKTGDIVFAYADCLDSAVIRLIESLRNDPARFYILEFSVIFWRFTRLEHITRSLDKNEHDRIMDYLVIQTETLLDKNKGLHFPDYIESMVKKTYNSITVHKKNKLIRSSFSGDLMQSPATRFIDCINARNRIRLLCEAIGKAERQ
jgi:hypothetical protein